MKRRRRRLYMRFPSWARRKIAYRRNYELHAYEDRVLVALITERRCACAVMSSPRRVAAQWYWAEPDRWDRTYLVMAFKRLRKQPTLDTVACFERARAVA